MHGGISHLDRKISLTTKSEIRYEGIFYFIDTKESTIALTEVRSFGTEDRPTEHPVAPGDEVYEFVVFRGSDVKDYVIEPRKKQTPLSGLPNDPAIVQHSASVPPTSNSFNQSGSSFRQGEALPSYHSSIHSSQHIPQPFATSSSQPSGFGGVNPNFNVTTRVEEALMRIRQQALIIRMNEHHQRLEDKVIILLLLVLLRAHASLQTKTSAVSSDSPPTSGTVFGQVKGQQKCVNSVNIKVAGALSQSTSSPTKYTWTVNALPRRTDVYGIKSPEICHGHGRWCLCLYPNGLPGNRPSNVTNPPVNQGDQYIPLGDMVLAVVPKNTVPPGFYGQDHWKIDVRLPDKTLLKSFHSKKTFAGGNARCRYFVLPFEVVKQVRHSADQCSLIVEMMSEAGAETVAEASSQAALTSGIDRLTQDLKDMLASGDTSDVTVRVKGQKDFQVHRNILRARTPAFASMFEDQMSGNTTDVINLEGCEPDTFQRFLQYVYTGRVEDLSLGNARDLYEVAKKYQMDSLKLDCLEYIKDSMSVESLCDILVLAHRHEEKELTELAMKFFADNISHVLMTVEWQNFLTENPIQANQLLINAHHQPCKKCKLVSTCV